MRVEFRLVDVFTPRPFAGNQLCVVPDPPPGLDSQTMQLLAREIGFSETTFVTEAVPVRDLQMLRRAVRDEALVGEEARSACWCARASRSAVRAGST